MAWVVGRNNSFTPLGTFSGNTYRIEENCVETLETILSNVRTEDCSLRSVRRNMASAQTIKNDLIPLLIHVKDNSKIHNATKIIDIAIEILVELTIPVEYIVSVDNVSNANIVLELNKSLNSSKELFADNRNTKAIVDHMKYLIEHHRYLTMEHCQSINNCLLLLRNVLHIPEAKTSTSNPLVYFSVQNQIIWNLFTQSIDKILIYLLSCSQNLNWGVTIVQLIALLYKDQHVGTLQKLLNQWLEASLSESSEDNESNTSPPEQGSGGSSPFITSDPTSDSSDTGGGHDGSAKVTSNPRTASIRNKTLTEIKRNKSTETEASTSSSGIYSNHSSFSSKTDDAVPAARSPAEKKLDCPSSQSEISDCGYVTQIENQESISTSSNDDDQPQQKHQKPHSFQKTRYSGSKSKTLLEKKELRRKKLVKRSKANILNVKGLMHHLPTDEDITNLLKEFTVDFLLKGYGTMVRGLHSQLLTNLQIQIDTSHFFWLVTYFLKFATQLELELEHIHPVLSYDILSYLVFQGVWTYEELQIISRIPNFDLKPCLRRLHLVVTAIKEFLQATEMFKKMMHLSEEDRESLQELQVKIVESEDLRALFVLLLRQYNPKIQSKQYLKDIIVTNHNYLLFADKTLRMEGIIVNFNLMDHLKQFANVEVMRQYGILLENFKENGEFVNNCIFTMMHHIGGDLEHVPTLFQPVILKTFSQIWETDYEICDDWSDLIEYVIHKFINTPKKHCSSLGNCISPDENEKIKNCDKNGDSTRRSSSEWTNEEKNNLLDYYKESVYVRDTIANITKKYEENGMGQKTQISIIRELLEQNIIDEIQFNDFLKCDRTQKRNSENNRDAPECDINSFNDDTPIEEDLKVLKDYLFKDNKGKFVNWLQNILLETCFAKLTVDRPALFENVVGRVEPTIYYFALLHLPVPVIPWTSEQNAILKHQPFILLLHKLGFYLPVDTGKIFVRIPSFWNADYIYSLAQKLGPIDPTKLKFSVDLLNDLNREVSSSTDRITPGELRKASDFSQSPSLADFSQFKNNQLSIAIPQIEVLSSAMPAPELSIVNHVVLTQNRESHTNMEFSPIADDIEHNSTCETASVTSDLTRMCVSDEEDKIVLLIEKKSV